MKRNYVAKIIVLLMSFLVPVAFSDWIYLNETSNITTKNEDECVVNIYKVLQTGDASVSSRTESKKTQDNSVQPRTFSEETGRFGSTYDNNKFINLPILVSLKSSFSSDGLKETLVTSYKQEKVISKETTTVDFLGNKYRFTYKIAWFVWTSSATITRSKTSLEKIEKTVNVSKYNYVKPLDLGIDGYNQYSYFSDSSCKNLFDFNKPINGDTNIYIKYISGKSGLTDFINSKTSGTNSIYDGARGGSSGNYDVVSDPAYETSGYFDYLNEATVSSGSTVNFVYLENKLYPSPNSGAISSGDGADHRDSKANVALDYYNGQYIGTNHCSLMVRLNGDLTVKGTLNIGAKVGGVSSNGTFSQIIGEYTQLDLNGHDLIIDGGTVNCYGSIVDRIGGGKILVKNKGKIMGLLTVTDGRGGNQMTYGYGKGQSPFDEYRFAYIEAPIVAMHGTTVAAYLKLDLGSLGISNIYANIIGESGSSVFSWGDKKTEDDCFKIVPYINTNLYPSQTSGQGGNSVYLKMYYYRYKYIFYADVILNSKIPLNTTVNFKGLVKKEVSIDWARIGVPIPPFFDVIVSNGHSLTLKAKMILLPGSSLTTQKETTLIFDPGDLVKYDDVKMAINVVIIDLEVYIKGESTRNRGGLMAYDRSFYSYNANGKTHFQQNTGVYTCPDYWKYTKASNHMILGDVEIRDMPDSYKYLVSGPISFSKKSVQALINSNFVQTYDIKGEQNGSRWFDGDNTTYKSSYNLITSFNVLPLISNGAAYIKDSSINLKGTFDSVTRLFNASNGKKYFLWTKNDFLKDGSTPEDQNSLTDYDVKPTIVDGELNNQIVKAANTYYLNYKGVFVPILDSLNSGTTYSNVTANIRKFCSNNSTNLYQNSSKYDKVKLNFNSTNKIWEYIDFA